ncbi:MAG: biopolymer transporter ExbD [Bdellovibrionaceae bacterium]|nr:biopolymer transporter ExbD [Bdellovibrio sp.]
MAGNSNDFSSDGENISVITGINITPFVDVVLVLLVIFMITAPALVKEVMDIRLPKTNSGDGQIMQTLGVAVNKDGNFLLNGVITDEEGLKAAVKETLAKAPNAQAIISADTEVAYGRVVKAIDILKSSGLEKFAVQIERETKTAQ